MGHPNIFNYLISFHMLHKLNNWSKNLITLKVKKLHENAFLRRFSLHSAAGRIFSAQRGGFRHAFEKGGNIYTWVYN